MNDPKNLTIAMLCVSAAILTTVLLLLPAADQARADTPVRGGDYIMVTGAYSSHIDLLYVVDRSQQKLNAYVLDLNRGDLIAKSQVNLKLAFQRGRAGEGE
jgi:hypothetical protein